MEYESYIKPELLILIPVLYITGIALKKSSLADKWIPLFLGAISIVLSTIWIFANSEIHSIQQIITSLFTAVTQGILLAGTSTYTNQLYVQAKKEE